MQNDEQLAYSLKHARKLIDHSHSGFYALINKGKIKSFKIGGKRLISARELERFVAEAEQAEERGE